MTTSTASTIRTVDPKELTPSPFNPPGRCDDIEDILATARDVGIIETLLAREEPSGLELVFGHRRLAAALELGLEAIRIEVRELSDDEVIMLQWIENQARKGFHPLDEAAHLKRMIDTGIRTDALASALGQTAGYIAKRVALLNLSDASADDYRAGKFGHAVALVVATIADELDQAKMVEELLRADQWDSGDPTGPREAKKIAAELFILDLRDAQFALDDADLVPKAGPCTTCPFRTGNQALLFDDASDGPDSCTKRACYREKADAYYAKRVEEVEGQGGTLLTKTKAKKIFSYGGSKPGYGCGYSSLEEKDGWKDDAPTLREELAKAEVTLPTILAQAPNGRVVELVKSDDLKKARSKMQREKKKAKSKNKPTKAELAEAATRKKDREKETLRVLKRDKMIGAIVDRAEKAPASEVLAWFVKRTIEHHYYDQARSTCRRRGIAASSPQEETKKLGKELKGRALIALAVELNLPSYVDARDAKEWGVDMKACEKEAKAEIAAAKKAKVAKKKPAAKKKPVAKKKAKAKAKAKKKPATKKKTKAKKKTAKKKTKTRKAKKR